MTRLQGERVVIRPLRPHELPGMYSVSGDRTRSTNQMTFATADFGGDS